MEMKRYRSLREAEPVWRALSASARLRIMEILYEQEDKSFHELACELGLTNSAITMHISKLEEADLIEVQVVPGKRGNRKVCRPKYSRLYFEFDEGRPHRRQNVYEDDIRIGYYTKCEVAPTCGISTEHSIIGELDAPKYFFFPEHFEAEVLWFGYGFVEYQLPNHLKAGQKVTQMELSFEISAECPGFCEDYPSDIHFYLNGILLGVWISPGDFGARRGRLAPEWWPDTCNQYGLLKTLTINEKGTFLDNGIQLGPVTIQDLNLDYSSFMEFRFAVPRETKNCGGFTIFGRTFGDYAQGIRVRVFYEE